ncbi:MAG: zeta toxin family protein [Proteobacteria bacterium]|nr:zeta toxin family protein [Pseudomonadota bacterium]
MSKIFYLIAGANGSGKTTLAKELLREEKGLEFLNADEIAEKIGDDIGLRAGKIILESVDKLLAAKKSVAMESTIAGKYHERIMQKFKKNGYEIVLIYVFLNRVELNLSRIQMRVLLGGHNVPKEDVIRRFYKSVRNFWSAIKLADSWQLYYNGGDDYEKIAFGRNDIVEILNDDVYDKFKRGFKNE